MSREAAAIVDRQVDPHLMLDDCRLQLPSNNIFRFCAHNGMPSVPDEASETVCFRTAAEIEDERVAAKKAALGQTSTDK